MRAWVLVVVTAAAGAALDCGGDAAALPEVDCTPPVPTFAEVRAFRSNCANCHSIQLASGDRMGAPVGMDYDVHASAAAVAVETAHSVFTGSMPPSGGIQLADKDIMYRWCLCGAPP